MNFEFERPGMLIGEMNDKAKAAMIKKARGVLEQPKKIETEERSRTEAIELMGMLINLHYKWTSEVPKEDVVDNSRRMVRISWFQQVLSSFELLLSLCEIKYVHISPELLQKIPDYVEKINRMSHNDKSHKPIKGANEKINEIDDILQDVLEELALN